MRNVRDNQISVDGGLGAILSACIRKKTQKNTEKKLQKSRTGKSKCGCKGGVNPYVATGTGLSFYSLTNSLLKLQIIIFLGSLMQNSGTFFKVLT